MFSRSTFLALVLVVLGSGCQKDQGGTPANTIFPQVRRVSLLNGTGARAFLVTEGYNLNFCLQLVKENATSPETLQFFSTITCDPNTRSLSLAVNGDSVLRGATALGKLGPRTDAVLQLNELCSNEFADGRCAPNVVGGAVNAL